jgi:hypothetical protein
MPSWPGSLWGIVYHSRRHYHHYIVHNILLYQVIQINTYILIKNEHIIKAYTYKYFNICICISHGDDL